MVILIAPKTALIPPKQCKCFNIRYIVWYDHEDLVPNQHLWGEGGPSWFGIGQGYWEKHFKVNENDIVDNVDFKDIVNHGIDLSQGERKYDMDYYTKDVNKDGVKDHSFVPLYYPPEAPPLKHYPFKEMLNPDEQTKLGLQVDFYGIMDKAISEADFGIIAHSQGTNITMNAIHMLCKQGEGK